MAAVYSKEEIISLAKHTLFHTNLLINMSDSWLSEDEGIKNVKKIIKKRLKKNNQFF